ncbi:MAG: ATP synthase F1 subunit gamma [Ignavibacteria bacterium]|nr:ATP synthase F1 subunit gamma [Ignavibacteria bacterium]
MATLREIRRRITGVKSTQQITKAMKMVAAAKLRKAQEAILNIRPYSNKMADLLHSLPGKIDKSISPLLMERETKNVTLIIVTSDRGLCGSFNSNLIRSAAELIQTEFSSYRESGNLNLMCIGKKGSDFFSKRNYQVKEKYLGIFSDLQFSSAKEIIQKVTNSFLNGTTDKVYVIYNEFKSIISQKIKVEQILPIPETHQAEKNEKESKYNEYVDFIYEPSKEEILTKILPQHLNILMWRVLLESNASEHGARMTAMDNATENAKELIRLLSLSYNRARQASITKELLEIVAGADALKESA